ncbi:MAG: OmpA family protein, partial [Nitrospirae bacterium]
PKETEVEERVVPSVKEEVPPKETVKPLYGLILSVRQYYFAFNSPYPDPATRRQIDEFIEFLKDKDIKKIIIEGFACAHGPNWYNYYLSKKRALVVKNYLKKKLSLQDDVFEIKFYGEGMLEVPELPSEAPESEHAKLNRRVVIKVLYKVE